MTTTARSRLGKYDIDTTASTISFRTRHVFGLGPVRGTFTVHSGTVDVCDPVADSRVHVHIDAASFRTGNQRRDANVRSARFLDTDRYPYLTFVAERLADEPPGGAGDQAWRRSLMTVGHDPLKPV